MNKYGYSLIAAVLGTTAFATTTHANDTQTMTSQDGYSLSLDLGYVKSRSNVDVPFAYNNNTGGTYHEGLGDGSLAGVTFRMPLDDTMGLSVRYRGTALENDTTISTGSGACDVGPTLGLINDCWDASHFKAETTTDQFDVVVDFQLAQEGSFKVTPFVGARYLQTSQDMYTDYYYDSGVSNYITNASDFKGYGLFAGVKTRMELSESMYFSGTLSAGKVWGERDLKINDYELNTPPGTFSSAAFAHTESNLNPWTAEVELAVGFDLGDDAPTIEVGYQGNYVQDLIDTRNTNNDGAPANSIGGNSSLWENTLFGRVTFAF
ncbi:MAG TPA: hypothetical protein VIM96_11180 [Pseudomonadales bacterium]